MSFNRIPALVRKMAWRRPGDQPLSEPMMVSLPTHIWVIRPQWVNSRWLVTYTSYQSYHMHAHRRHCISTLFELISALYESISTLFELIYALFESISALFKFNIDASCIRRHKKGICNTSLTVKVPLRYSQSYCSWLASLSLFGNS